MTHLPLSGERAIKFAAAEPKRYHTGGVTAFMHVEKPLLRMSASMKAKGQFVVGLSIGILISAVAMQLSLKRAR